MNKKKKLKIPRRLFPGDTVGIVAPAGPFNQEAFSKGISALESMGFNPFVPKNLFKRMAYLAGSDNHRAKLMNDLFIDDSIKAIICARGGFGSMRILPLLDYDSIQKHPKIFIGFSDISAILSVLYARCGLITFHGPMVTTLGRATQKAKESFISAVASDIPREMTPKKGIIIRSGRASGPIAGGNLTTLCHLVGTPFAPSYRGHILFLEDKGEALYRIDRMLTQMRLAGCFDGLAGLLLGSFIDCGNEDDVFKIVESVFSRKNIPILAGFEMGHGTENLMLPLGLEAALNTDKKLLSFHDCATTA